MTAAAAAGPSIVDAHTRSRNQPWSLRSHLDTTSSSR